MMTVYVITDVQQRQKQTDFACLLNLTLNLWSVNLVSYHTVQYCSLRKQSLKFNFPSVFSFFTLYGRDLPVRTGGTINSQSNSGNGQKKRELQDAKETLLIVPNVTIVALQLS